MSPITYISYIRGRCATLLGLRASQSHNGDVQLAQCEASANTLFAWKVFFPRKRFNIVRHLRILSRQKKMFFGEQDHTSYLSIWGHHHIIQACEKGTKKCNMSYEQDSISVKISHIPKEQDQTWNLSKILHRRIFRLKIIHRQFHLISTVLIRKITKNELKCRNLHC